jgi:hypothetical protein
MMMPPCTTLAPLSADVIIWENSIRIPDADAIPAGNRAAPRRHR